jgi:hypothetical protein
MSETQLAVPETRAVERLSAAQIRADVNLIQEVVKAVMIENVHYGTVPGCGDKPTLLKPGAEKIASTFRLAIDPQVEDLSKDDEIRYRVSARVTHQGSGQFLGCGIGEASTNEVKYKWRKVVSDAEWDATPEDKRRIKYADTWTQRQVRTNPADVANTVLKMAKKRALIDAVLTITAASDCFTQDIEDMPEELATGIEFGGGPAPVQAPKARTEAAPVAPPPSPAPKSAPQGEVDAAKLRKMVSKFPGECESCGGEIAKGTPIYYDGNRKVAYHETCVSAGE